MKSLYLSLQQPWLAAEPEPAQGDIMMFYSQEYDKILVKRVIGLPGQTVSFADGAVLIDGTPLEEDYLPAGTETWPGTAGETLTVPAGAVLLLGDNRGNSLDSRYRKNPFIPLSDLRAKPWRRYPGDPAAAGRESTVFFHDREVIAWLFPA